MLFEGQLSRRSCWGNVEGVKATDLPTRRSVMSSAAITTLAVFEFISILRAMAPSALKSACGRNRVAPK